MGGWPSPPLPVITQEGQAGRAGWLAKARPVPGPRRVGGGINRRRAGRLFAKAPPVNSLSGVFHLQKSGDQRGAG